MDNTASTILTILCISSPLFFTTTALLAVLLFIQHRRRQSETSKYIQTLNQYRGWSHAETKELQVKILELETRINILQSEAIKGLRDKWFEEVSSASYNSEVEVEIKLIYLLIRFLGYDINDIKTRVAIEVQVGRQKVSGAADWVIYKNPNEKPFLIIEAKAPSQQISNAVQEQARSYAFALNAPFYLLTNGKEIVVLERKVDEDIVIIGFSTKNIGKNWGKLEQSIGKLQDYQ